MKKRYLGKKEKEDDVDDDVVDDVVDDDEFIIIQHRTYLFFSCL